MREEAGIGAAVRVDIGDAVQRQYRDLAIAGLVQDPLHVGQAIGRPRNIARRNQQRVILRRIVGPTPLAGLDDRKLRVGAAPSEAIVHLL